MLLYRLGLMLFGLTVSIGRLIVGCLWITLNPE